MCCASPTPPTTCSRSPATSATTARRSRGIPRSAATYAPVSTPSTSTSTVCPREDAAYILDTFPIVRRHDEAAYGSYGTRDLILAYMNALAAGDTETVVAL